MPSQDLCTIPEGVGGRCVKPVVLGLQVRSDKFSTTSGSKSRTAWISASRSKHHKESVRHRGGSVTPSCWASASARRLRARPEATGEQPLPKHAGGAGKKYWHTIIVGLAS